MGANVHLWVVVQCLLLLLLWAHMVDLIDG